MTMTSDQLLDRGSMLTLALWTTVTWGGGPLLARHIASAMRERRFAEGAVLAAGPVANVCVLVGAQRRRSVPARASVAATALRAAGLMLGWAGMGWAIAARRQLADAWTPRIEPPDALRATGPYRVVRHPIYAGAIVLYSGLALAYRSPTATIVCGAHVVGFVVKTAVEDRRLLDASERYRAYARVTPGRLVPHVR